LTAGRTQRNRSKRVKKETNLDKYKQAMIILDELSQGKSKDDTEGDYEFIAFASKGKTAVAYLGHASEEFIHDALFRFACTTVGKFMDNRVLNEAKSKTGTTH